MPPYKLMTCIPTFASHYNKHDHYFMDKVLLNSTVSAIVHCVCNLSEVMQLLSLQWQEGAAQWVPDVCCLQAYAVHVWG